MQGKELLDRTATYRDDALGRTRAVLLRLPSPALRRLLSSIGLCVGLHNVSTCFRRWATFVGCLASSTHGCSDKTYSLWGEGGVPHPESQDEGNSRALSSGSSRCRDRPNGVRPPPVCPTEEGAQRIQQEGGSRGDGVGADIRKGTRSRVRMDKKRGLGWGWGARLACPLRLLNLFGLLGVSLHARWAPAHSA